MSESLDAGQAIGPDPTRELPLDELADEICASAARIAAATARWLALVAEFDRREGWGGIGMKSCAHWLAWRCGLGPNSAREHVRVARALTGLPRIGAAFAEGRLSYSSVRALTRIADTDNETDLLELGLACTAAQVERVVRGWRRADRLSDPEPAETARFGLQVHWDDDGSLRLSGRLSAEDGALLLTALEAAAERVDAQRPAPSAAEQEQAEQWAAGGGGPYSPRQRCPQAEAMVEVARVFLDPDPARQSAAARHQVIVHVDADVLAADTAAGAAYLDGGPALSAEQVARIGCDASLVVLLRRGREVVDVGRATRRIPAAMNRALWARDGGCRFPGCTERRRRHVQGHHIRFWSRGGRTALDNLVLLCGYHHRQVHQAGFAVLVDEQGVLACTDPRGTPLAEHPPTGTADRVPLPPADGTPHSLWVGEPLDLHYAVSVLLDRRSWRRGRAGPETAAA